MRLRPLACAALLAAASPAAADTGGTFRDWALSCTPGLLCSAATFASGNETLMGFGLERGAAAEAPLRLTLLTGADTKPTGEVVISVDGARALSLPASAFSLDGNGNAKADDPGIRGALLAKLRDGRTASVAIRTGAGAADQAFSLSGIVATLRKMDEDQGRVDTATALIDRGDKPLSDRASLPADIAAPEDLPEPVRALWKGAGGCDERDPDSPFGDLGFSVPFGTDTRLFVLACGMPGAYNFPSRLYSYSAGAASADVVPLAAMSATGPTADLTAWNVDLQGDRLSSFFKGRGVGDCGQTATWRIDRETGALTLVEARDKEDCDGEGGAPDTWPLVWPKR